MTVIGSREFLFRNSLKTTYFCSHEVEWEKSGVSYLGL